MNITILTTGHGISVWRDNDTIEMACCFLIILSLYSNIPP